MNSQNQSVEKATRKDGIFLFLSFAVSFIFIQFVLFPFSPNLAFGIVFFCVALYLTAFFYLRKSKMVFSKLSIITFIPVFAMTLSFFLYNNNTIFFLVNLMALWFFCSLNLLVMAGLEPYPFTKKTIGDVFRATFYHPFKNIGTRISSFAATKNKKNGKIILTVLLTIITITPAVLIVTGLLSNADKNFGELIDKIINSISDEVLIYLLKTFLALILTFPLFNLLYKLKNNLPEVKAEINKEKTSRELSPICSETSLFVFDVIYILYISLQAGYLFSAMFGVLPEGFTYSDYARRGFFELTCVVAFNLFVMALVYSFTKREKEILPPFCRILSCIMVLSTILLIITAISKMFLYIGTYGLTQLRVYTSFFMIVLLVCSIFLFIKILVPTFKFSKFASYSAVILFIVLNLSNVDAFVARYNINRYYATGKLDVSMFYELSDGAAPVIAELVNDSTYKAEIMQYFSSQKYEFERTGIENKSLSKCISYSLYYSKYPYTKYLNNF